MYATTFKLNHECRIQYFDGQYLWKKKRNYMCVCVLMAGLKSVLFFQMNLFVAFYFLRTNLFMQIEYLHIFHQGIGFLIHWNAALLKRNQFILRLVDSSWPMFLSFRFIQIRSLFKYLNENGRKSTQSHEKNKSTGFLCKLINDQTPQ